MPAPEIALSVTTYQKPWHLRRALASIAGQQGVAGRFELVVTDDGSTDETADIVQQFRWNVDFPVQFTTHEHAAFQVGRCRNDGARATTAPYLLFLDGDCVCPPDHVAIHLEARAPSRAILGDCLRIEEDLSKTLTEEGARRGDFLGWRAPGEKRRLDHQHLKTRLYSFLRHPRKPKLVGNNFGIWRADFERVNGFDERYCGWGQEDDDLGLRIRRAGVRLESILGRTRAYHLYHPRDPSATDRWRAGTNIPYFLRRGCLTRCRDGLVKRPLADLAIQVAGRPKQPDRVAQLWREAAADRQANFERTDSKSDRPEAEVLFLPGDGQFTGRAEFQVLVVLDGTPPSNKLLRDAHLVVADQKLLVPSGTPQFSLADFRVALDAIA